MTLVVPAVLPSSREDLEEKLTLFNSIPKVSRVQIDVVDGKLAAPASWPYNAPGTLEAMVESGETLPYLGQLSYEIDLMCHDSEHLAEQWLSLGATRLTFHAESTTNLSRLLASVRARCGESSTSGLLTLGVALTLSTDAAILEQCLGDIAYVQFMGIRKIGKQGQPFDESVITKVRAFHQKHPDIPLQVDGGVTITNAPRLIAAGITNLVVGSGILKASDPLSTFSAFEALQNPFGV